MNNFHHSGVILINAFSRANSLRRCLECINISNEDYLLPVLVVLQNGFHEVEVAIDEYSSMINRLVRVDGSHLTALENINRNRYLGYKIAFEELRAEWVLAIEEDVEISSDAIRFCDEIFCKYSKTPFFKGINLGSREKYSQEDALTYSRQRYGLHGQASVITKKTWQKFNHKKIQKKFSTHGFDSLVEFNLKTGFMITPNNSRSLDTGWDGTHLPGDKGDPYFVEIAESFVGTQQAPTGKFIEREMHHHWRSDIEIYKFFKTPSFFIIAKWNLLKHNLKEKLKNFF